MKVYIETLGCPKNFNDSQVAAGLLEKGGHRITESIDEADAIMLNTCGFINDAKKESIERALELAEYRNEGKILIVSGCLTERYSEELYKEMPEIDVIIGVNDYARLPEILTELEAKQGKSKERKMSVSEIPCGFDADVYRKFEDHPYTATVKIAEGCDNRCAYCIIPAIRGSYRSKKQEDVVREVSELAKRGTKEIILIAQDVTYYGMDLYGEMRLPKLLREICKVDGIEWVRLMYCYEDRITDELIEVMASEPKICHYIDIPIQHSSDVILAAMKRRSTSASIRKTIGKLRSAMPDINIRTTLITGFPGEKQAEFKELLAFVEEMKFERLGVFAYSKEEGTEAAEMHPQVRQDVKERRAETIMAKQVDISLASNREKIGRVLEVLIEEIDEDGSYIGRSRYDAPEIDNSVIFTSDRELNIGDIVNVKINDAFDYDLVGKEQR
ncbi:MAG: 30S ribosomal protein S12 methylthiotransferase RimO [Firmicutes bacterium]|nr:30S ribosomal protein S12 methylthiotransferase RimO [Bacillota bacterium]